MTTITKTKYGYIDEETGERFDKYGEPIDSNTEVYYYED